ncbi:tyrosine-type recombinase/integrase [Falsiruegeria litorea]|uniref:tyrosine-type recombinase/integrase n=1 Tax=Falsiruegeria litorea TaxID=1280831 RepID=UPI001BFE9904|nr:site-specific integrase [Falsiruegeria litorea]MBT8169819.1 site-specific integrase [Falsiruegeria litorea]
MASFRKHSKGWRVEVFRQGIRKSKIFPTKREAQDWAARTEFEIQHADKVADKTLLGDVFDRYAREVSPKKKGGRWEVIRLEKLQKDKIAKIQLGRLAASDFATWRDARLKEVQPASVIREMQLMSSVLSTARREWGLISSNPLSDVSKPRKPPPRDRLPTQDEIETMLHCSGSDLAKATARAFHAFRFALETAMRAGEIAGLEWERVDLDRRVVRLIHTKNGRPRDVPLSTKAVELLEALPNADPVFGLSSRQLDVLFRKSRDKANVVGLTFHDSRHAAITALSKKLDVLDLARMVGHSDIRQLMTYYNESAENIAKRLD